MLEEDIWHRPEGEERTILGKMIISECKRTASLSFGIMGFFVLCMIAGICEILFGDRDPQLFSTSILAVPIVIFMLPDTIVLVRYIRKVRNGLFRSSDVEIIHKEQGTSTGRRRYYVSVRPVDSEETVVVEIGMGLYGKLRLGSTGKLFVVDDEKVRLTVCPYWFVSDTDYSMSPDQAVIDTDSEENRAGHGFALSEDVKQDISKWYIKENRFRAFVLPVICLVLFIIGEIYIGYGTLTDNLPKKLVALSTLFGIIIYEIPIFIVTASYRHMSLEGKRFMMLIWSLWFILNCAGLGFVLIPHLSEPVRLLILALMFLLNVGSICFVNRNLFRSIREIEAGRYASLNVTVLSMDREIVTGRIKHLLLVKDQGGRTFEVKVSMRQYKHAYSGAPGLLIIPDKMPEMRIFKGENTI